MTQPYNHSPQTSPFINDVRNAIRLEHYSLATERSYCYYILIRSHDGQPSRPHHQDEIKKDRCRVHVRQHVRGRFGEPFGLGIQALSQHGDEKKNQH